MKTILAVLSGDITKGGQGWHTKDLDDAQGAGGTESFRIAAATRLAREDPALALLLLGGRGKDERPSLSSVMRAELLTAGVPAESLSIEESSTSTYEQLVYLEGLVRADPALSVRILSNEWHLPRIAAMIAHAPGLQSLRTWSPQLIAAEAVLLEGAPGDWAERIAAVRAAPALARRRALEAQGVTDLMHGRYHFGPK